MTTARRVHYRYEDYLAALEVSSLKLEYCDGEIYAMAGGTPAHAQLSAALVRLLGNALLGPCAVFTSDLKVRVEPTDLSTFPDVTVVCGEPMLSSIDKNAVVNPTVLVEVTSQSTEDYDRGEKLSHYKQCASLRAVLFVSHRHPQLSAVVRAGAGWEERVYRLGERLQLESPELSLAVDDVYAGVALDSRPSGG